jgi:signal recognition particle subunit SEC65
MKIYDYGKIKSCLICGNIDGNFDRFIKTVVGSLRNLKSYVVETHPKEIERQERLARKREEESHNGGGGIFGGPAPHYAPRPTRLKKPKMMNCGYNLTDTVIIVDGCNGFGERDLKYYHDKLEMFNNVLADNNTHVLFVRGNDDPKYFEDALIDLSNIKTIQDYSVIKLSKFNCLCIGGCVSLDRTWRMEQEKRVGRKMYWENERMQYNEEDIDKILKEYNIACVVTASCPSFAYPGMNSFKYSTWASKDKTVIKDITEERMIMDKIYNKIVENNKKPYIWTYSRFKNSNQNMINDILFQSLNPFQFFHFNDTASSFFKIDFSKMLKENEYVADSFEKKMKAHVFTYNDPFADEDIGEPMEDEEMIDEENIPEAEGDEADRDFIDEMLAEEDNNGRDNGEGVAAGDGIWQALDAPIPWNPGRYAIYDDGTVRRATNAAVIDHDNVIRPNEETVRGMRDELDRLTAEMIGGTTITANNTNDMIYYDPTALRGAIATDNGEGHG